MDKKKFGENVVYYTSKCLLEDFHLHVNKPHPIDKGAAKIWVNPNTGEYQIAECGKYSERVLHTLCRQHIIPNIIYFADGWRNRNNGVLTVYVDIRSGNFTA